MLTLWLSPIAVADFLAQCHTSGAPSPAFQTSPTTLDLCAYLTPAQALALQRALGTHSSPAMKAITRALGPPAPTAFPFHPLGHQDHTTLGLARGQWPRASY